MSAEIATESRERAHYRWILGRYLQLVAALQIVIYATATWARDPNPGLMYIDPRLFVHFAYGFLVPGRQSFPSAASWLCAIGLFCLGEGVVGSRGWLAVYAVVEGTYVALWLAVAMMLIATGLSSAHGFSAQELLLPFVAFFFGSAAPVLVALPLWRAPDYGD